MHIKLPKANIKYQSALEQDLTFTPPQHLYVCFFLSLFSGKLSTTMLLCMLIC